MVEVEDVSPFLVSDIINVLWPLLYDTGTRWECCLLDELETAVEGCVQVVHNSSELSTAGQSTNEPRDGSGPLPREAAVWWLALNQTCPYYDGGASQWLFIEARAATTANGSFFALRRPLPANMAAAEELEGLSRILTRLALTEDDRLEQVLSKLLPIVIGKLGPGAAPTVQKKVLEILSHVNKRLRALPAVQLPLKELAAIYAAPGTPPMARNFALVYLEQAVERAAPADRFAELPTMLTGLSTRPAQHQDMLLRLAAQCWEHMAASTGAPPWGSEAAFAARFSFLARAGEASSGASVDAGAAAPSPTAAADRALVLRFASRLMLYQPPSFKGPSNPLAAAQAAAAGGNGSGAGAGGAQPMEIDAAGGGAAAAAAPLPGVPAGMSRQDVAAVEGKAPPAGQMLLRSKLGFLNFSAAAGWDPTEVLQTYLAAACDPNEQISRRGDELLKKRCGMDSQRPPVDLESFEVIESLFELWHGTADDTSLPEEERHQPAGVALRARLLNLFCKSMAAANCFPHPLTTVTVCLYGASTTPRLRQGGMEFAVWVFKHAAPEQLAPAAPSILDSLLTLLDDASTHGSDVTSLTLRGFTYQAIGQLSQRQPQAFAGHTDIAARFFSALSTEPAGVRAAVQEATASLASAFRGAAGDTATALQQLLLDSVQAQQPEPVRMAALQWAIKLFPFGHIPARHLCILASADPRFQLAEAAAEGLQPGKFASGVNSNAGAGAGAGAGDGSPATGAGAGAAAPSKAASGEPDYPSFGAMLEYLQGEGPSLARRPQEGAALALPAKALLAAINFLESCRRQEQQRAGPAGGLSPAAAASYLQLLENALLPTAPSELHAAALGAMLSVAAVQRAAFADAFAADGPRQQLLLRLLGHVDAGARQAAAQLLGLLVPHLGDGAAAGAAAAGQPQEQPRVAALCEPLLSMLRAGTAEGVKAAKQEQLEGAAAAAGYVAAHLIQGLPPCPPDLLLSLLTQLRQLLESPGAAASTTAGSGGLRAAAALALGHAVLPLAARRAGDGLQPQLQLAALPGAEEVAKSAAELLSDKDSKVVKRAATALGYLCWAHAAAPAQPAPAADAPAAASAPAPAAPADALLQPSVAALLALQSSKNEEVLFAVGEALCFCFGGLQVTPDDILHTPFASLASWKQHQQQAAEAAATAQQQAQHEGAAAAPMEAEGGAGGGSGGEAESPALAAARQQILGMVVDECMVSSRVETRCAGAVWLVSLLLQSGRHPRLAPLLPDIQAALSQLLGDPNELTQEMASRGLAAVYDLADEATRKALLDGLIATLSGAPQKRRAIKLSGESQLFEKGQLGATPGGGSLTTYKELCSLATDLGQPDLVYRFMELANHQAAVNSSRGAAFGFASIAKLAGEQLGPHIARILPRLYRYLYDPNGKVRDAMSHIWHALLDDPKAAVAQNFDAIMKALLADLGGGQWRVREAAALAMSDLLQGRRWDELAPHFAALWEMTLRVMDDIKESVRVAGVALARSVRGLTLRLVDPELTPPSQGRQAVAVTLPLLLEKGLNSQVAEVRGLALGTTCKLAAAAGPEVLRPHMPLLVPAMLESLSALEDQRLNYIEQHAERMGLDSGRLEGARVAAAQGGPAGDARAVCTVGGYMDAATMAELAPKLGELVRRGTGLNTRAGAGRFITQVTRRLGGDMQPLAAQLIKALTEACRADRSAAVRRAYAAAAATLCRHAPRARVARFVSDCLASLAAENADRDDRYVAGLLLRELGKEASDVLTAHAGEVAPLAYMAQFDEDADVAAMWHEVWEECTASAGAGLRLHITKVLQLVTAGMQSGQWGRKKAAAAVIADISKASGDALAPHAPALLDVLLKELPGRLWEGKEVVLTAAGAVAGACPEAVPAEQRRRLVVALLDAGCKKRAVYRKAGLEQLEAALLAFSRGGNATNGGTAAAAAAPVAAATGGSAGAGGEDYYSLVAPALLELAGSYVEAAQGAAAMETDGHPAGGGAAPAALAGGQGEEDPHPGKAVPAAQVAACLGAAFATAAPETAHQHADAAAGALAGLLGAAGKPADQLAAVTAACRLAEHAARVAGGAGTGEAAAAAPMLTPQQPGMAALLQGALRLAEEGKAAQLREACYKLSDLLLPALWPALPGEERDTVLTRLGEAESREKLPAVKSLAAQLAAKLRALA
ncbi:proteasome-associated ECM29-like protein [Micractinium conductrix]|uniref:Proteasome-associated ECM29-like protein n=1 Tax=Micractinium conductrix TaxID=554055 RepID=A0A2P6VC99_9CHLO|nr:proteasome-associated ECM29-like protein [Micractinium conductrix]|eukprot:PSC71704.1 proteasome-associated ECM29-like protein [Micractinium conductrix]